jgi:hypothetical protein
MSTRGVIAIQNGDGFIGRYHHWDSYPKGLGKTLYDWAQQMPLEEMLELLLHKHPAGWSAIVGKNPKLEPGFYSEFNPDRKCVVCGMKYWEHYRQYYENNGRPIPKRFKNVPKDTYLLTDHSPEPEKLPVDDAPQCYCHGERSEPELLVTDANASGMGCEYAYVFNKERRTMTILSSYCDDGAKMIGMFGMGDPEAKWCEIATVNLDGPEPDWDKIEKTGR